MTILDIIESGLSTRYHVEPIPIKQDLAQHQWGVAMILYHICQPSPQLIQAALTHDIAERWVGDMPAPVKWGNLELSTILDQAENGVLARLGLRDTLANLTTEEKGMLRLADYLEAMSFAARIYSQGVQYGLKIVENLWGVMLNRFDVQHNAAAVKLLNQILEICYAREPFGDWRIRCHYLEYTGVSPVKQSTTL